MKAWFHVLIGFMVSYHSLYLSIYIVWMALHPSCMSLETFKILHSLMPRDASVTSLTFPNTDDTVMVHHRTKFLSVLLHDVFATAFNLTSDHVSICSVGVK